MKKAYGIFLIITLLAVATLLFIGTAQIITYFKTGAKRETAPLSSSLEIELNYRPKVSWSNTDKAEGRKIEKGTLGKITKDYLAGEFYQNDALYRGKLGGTKDYFTKSQRDQLNKLIVHHESSELKYRATGLEHNLTLKFYSEDGTIAVLEDKSITYHQILDDTLVYDQYDSALFDVMLLLEDNFWRIRHKVRRRTFTKTVKRSILDNSSLVSVQQNKFIRNGKPMLLKGINYYPQQFPWTLMWDNFEKINLTQDFKQLQELGVNTIRIFVPYDKFGGAEVSSEKLAQLTQLLDLAQRHNLQVIITLFDFFLGYDINNWTLTDRHAEQIVKHLKAHPALLAWDLKNEPDLDFEIHGQTHVVNWLKFISSRIKGYDPEHLITIGWSQPEVSNTLQDIVDFNSFHFFRKPQELKKYFAEGGQNFQKPQFLGETGIHSYDRWWFPFSKNEIDQRDYLEEVLQIANEYNISYAVWTLYDFSEVPENVTGNLPWRRNPQKKYGLIDEYSNPKPAYQLLMKMNHEK